jgi:hypothetical protein
VAALSRLQALPEGFLGKIIEPEPEIVKHSMVATFFSPLHLGGDQGLQPSRGQREPGKSVSHIPLDFPTDFC